MIPAFLADIENRKRKVDDEHRAHAGLDIGSVWYNEPDDDFEDDDDIVLETKGGSVPAPASPMEEARAQISIDNAAEERRRAQAAEEAARAEAERQDLLRRAATAQSRGYAGAVSLGENELATRGINDTYGIMDSYLNKLESIKSTIGEDVTDVSGYYSPTVFNSVYNDVQDRERRNLMNNFNNDYGEGFSENYFGANADDAIIADILRGRQSDAQSVLDRAYARGQINDNGLTYAQSRLGEQEAAANARLQELGGGVLASYRRNLEDFAQGARDRIGDYTLGSYNPTENFADRLNTRVNEYQNTLRGGILQALGSTSLFDTSSLLSGAGSYQGVSNTTTPSTGVTLGSTSTTQLSPDAKKRNTGTLGTF